VCSPGVINVENPTCVACSDGIDNDADTRADSEDASCSILADAARFAVVATDTSTRAAARFSRRVSSQSIPGVDASLPYPLGPSAAGVCGGGMYVRSGVAVGLLATVGRVRFSRDGSRGPIADMGREIATSGGALDFRDAGPYVGPLVCSDDHTRPCTTAADCTAGSCTVRLRLSDTPNPFVSSNGSSQNHARCLATLASLTMISQGVAAYTPAASERVSLGTACPGCRAATEIRTSGDAVITLGAGLQVIDVEQVHLGGSARLRLRGQADTVLVIRVRGHLRLGARAAVILEDNGLGQGTLAADRVLWNVQASRSRTSLGAFSQFAGTLMTSGQRGIRVGSGAAIDGALFGRRVRMGSQSTVVHAPFTALLPLVP
jgi:hypothetical protein